MIDVVDLGQKFSQFAEPWHPKIVGVLNESYIKVVKLKGEFVWHRHAAEDELFLVVRGKLLIKLRDRDLELGPGQFVIIPKGVEHMPIAQQEVEAVLIEPRSTLNTGNVKDERTVEAEWI